MNIEFLSDNLKFRRVSFSDEIDRHSLVIMKKICFLFSALLILVGCTGPSGDSHGHEGSSSPLLSDDEIAEGISEQEEVIDRGSVSKEEYRKAYDNYFDCMSDLGIETIDQGWDPINHYEVIFQSDVDANGGHTDPDHLFDVQMDCGNAHLNKIQDAYRSENDPFMEEDLAIETVQCLEKYDLEVDEEFTSLHELITQDPAHTSLKEDCVREGMRNIYPDMSFVLSW